MIKGKGPEEIRRTFNIKNDFTPQEVSGERDQSTKIVFVFDSRKNKSRRKTNGAKKSDRKTDVRLRFLFVLGSTSVLFRRFSFNRKLISVSENHFGQLDKELKFYFSRLVESRNSPAFSTEDTRERSGTRIASWNISLGADLLRLPEYL